MDPVKIVGANGNRRDRDFYSTPNQCVYALCDFLNIPRTTRIWEPACGGGAIVKALHEKGYGKVIASDIATGIDFLTTDLPENVGYIITNPPFSLAAEFIEHGIELGVPFAYLLKIQYWNSKKRYQLFQSCPPKYILPLTWRPDFTGQGASLMDMMWVVWTTEEMGATLYRPLARPGED